LIFGLDFFARVVSKICMLWAEKIGLCGRYKFQNYK